MLDRALVREAVAPDPSATVNGHDGRKGPAGGRRVDPSIETGSVLQIVALDRARALAAHRHRAILATRQATLVFLCAQTSLEHPRLVPMWVPLAGGPNPFAEWEPSAARVADDTPRPSGVTLRRGLG